MTFQQPIMQTLFKPSTKKYILLIKESGFKICTLQKNYPKEGSKSKNDIQNFKKNSKRYGEQQHSRV